MNRNSTLIGLFCLLSILQSNTSSAINYVDNGSSTNYALNTGDSLHIASGTYTGTITSFSTGAKISVAFAAIFQPAAISFPNVRGTIYVYGTFRMSADFRTNTGFRIYNYGVVSINGNTIMSGSTQLWMNSYGALMNLNGDISLTNDNSIVNQGTINFGANLTMTGTTSIINKLNINVAGNYQNNGAVLTNQGKFYVNGAINFNSGLVYNHCRMIAESGIYNTSGQLFNYGFLWSKSSPGTGALVNSGTITNGPGSVILAISLNNTGTINGGGYMHFTGVTTTTNSGTTGAAGITADTIRMFDASRSNVLTIYDNQTGTVYPNVKFQAFSGLDSNKAYFGGCSMEMVSQIPLAVNWNHFFVTLNDKTPSLDWSAKADEGTRFEIQRSYDGKNFQTIDLVIANNATGYKYNDLNVNTKSAIVYYRILAVETTGTQKFSETRTVR
ncbi:MAG TPA: hypothetical protein VF476_02710, partial [Chitinophagaceae bacterium]